MRRFFFFLFFLCFWTMAHATVSFTGILVYVDGEETGYLFEQTPTATYTTDADGVKIVQLTLDNNPSPVLSLRLTEEAKLIIEYGDVQSLEGVSSPTSNMKVRKDGKFFVCGRLVIIKNGKKYDEGGKPIK